MAHKVTILSIGFATHDVKRYIVSKPDDYEYTPGQFTTVVLDKPGLRDDKRTFTFTGRPQDKVLEFTVKSYHDHNGVTHALWDSKPGDALHIGEPKGTIMYNKPGVFLAAGAGVTPFLSIFRTLWASGELQNCHLLYSNKTKADIIKEHELTHYFSRQGNGVLLTLTRKSAMGYVSGRITEAVLREFCPNCDRMAYICGPTGFVENMKQIVQAVGIKSDSIVFEK